MRVGQYSKAIIMILAAGVGIFTAANSDGVVTPLEYTNIFIGIAGAVLVYLLPNLPAGAAKYTKTIVAFGTAAAQAVAVIVANSADWSGVTSNDWISVVLAGLAAIGLYIIPNTKPAPEVTVVNTPAVETSSDLPVGQGE